MYLNFMNNRGGGRDQSSVIFVICVCGGL